MPLLSKENDGNIDRCFCSHHAGKNVDINYFRQIKFCTLLHYTIAKVLALKRFRLLIMNVNSQNQLVLLDDRKAQMSIVLTSYSSLATLIQAPECSR